MVPPTARRRFGFVFLAVLLMATDADGDEPKQVLLIQSFDQAQLVFGTVADTLRKDIARGLQAPVNFVEFSLQPFGFAAVPEQESATYLRSMFSGGRPPDLIVTIGGPAAEFAQRYRGELFPHTPLLLAAVDQRFVRRSALDPMTTAVATANDFPGTVENILHLLPHARTLFIVLGTSRLERTWQDALSQMLRPYENRVRLEWASTLSFRDLLRRSASLPPHSAILYILFIRDADGAGQVDEDVVRDVHAVANAPLFGIQSTFLGRGLVGGPLMPIERLGTTAAAVAVRILRGQPPGQIGVQPVVPGPPVFDSRELRRWGLGEDRLPPGSRVLFREPTAWDRHRNEVLAVAALVLGQGFLIFVLLRNHMIRRRAERMLRESEERFRQMASAAPVMIWISGQDRRYTDVNVAWLTFTGRGIDDELGDGWTQGVHPDDRAGCLDIYNRAFDCREAFQMEYRLRRHDGEYRWVLDCGVPRFMPGGSFAGYIGSAVDVTELKDARVALSGLSQRLIDAHEEERERLARELHDDVGQRMMALLILLDTMGDDPEDAWSRVRDARRLATDVARDLQSISHGLHPEKLKYLGLVKTARSLCADSAAAHNVRIDFSAGTVPDHVPPDVALALFRVLQEALANAIKHSGSRRFAVSLERRGECLALLVQDFGSGFDVDRALRGSGLGLISMQERLKLIGGTLTIESHYPTGTTVRAAAPLTSPDEESSEWSEPMFEHSAQARAIG